MLGASYVSFSKTFGRFWTGCREVVFDLDSSLFCVTTEKMTNVADGSVFCFLYAKQFLFVTEERVIYPVVSSDLT